MRSVWFRRNFVRSLKFLEIKEGGPNFRGEPILQKVWIIWSTLLYFYFKIVKEPNSPPIRRFNCIFYDSGEVFSDLWKLCKSKRGDLISWGNQFCRKFELFGPPFCIWILKLSRTQILRHFLDFNALCMIHKNFFTDFWNSYKLKREERNFWGEPVLKKVWIICSSLLYFNFKIFVDSESLSFIRFQCILHDSGVVL